MEKLAQLKAELLAEEPQPDKKNLEKLERSRDELPPAPVKLKPKHQWRSMRGYTLAYDASTRFDYSEDSKKIPQKPPKKRDSTKPKKRKQHKRDSLLAELAYRFPSMELTKQKFAEQEAENSKILQQNKSTKKQHSRYIHIVPGGMGRSH